MGWNSGYTVMEEQIVTLYDEKLLTKDILMAIMSPFKETDVDSGGSQDLRSKDGKSAENIICFIVEPEKYNKAIEEFVPDPEDPEWNESLYDLFTEIAHREWNIF